MSSLITSGPARRLLCHGCRQKYGNTAPWRALCGPDNAAVGRRPYAKVIRPTQRPPKASHPRPKTPAAPPTLSRVPKLSAKSIPGAGLEPERHIFSARDVPALPQWTSSLDNLGNGDLTAMQCMEGAQRYVAVATQHESLWRDKLEQEQNLSPYLLHWIGILLLSGNTAERWRLGTHILRSASELGYTPSTLTLVRIFRSMSRKTFEDKASKSKLYIAADARFRDIVKEGTDPDALTLQGSIYAEYGDERRALIMFKRAVQAWEKTNPGAKSADGQEGSKSGFAGKAHEASAAATSPDIKRSENSDSGATVEEEKEYVLPEPREPRWEWEVSCLLGQADALRNQGDIKHAEQLYRVAALELDNPRAFFQLASLMGGPRDSLMRRAYLLKAAVSGEPEACREMGELEKLAAAKQDVSERRRTEHSLLSKEWFRLAAGEELSSVRPNDADDGS